MTRAGISSAIWFMAIAARLLTGFFGVVLACYAPSASAQIVNQYSVVDIAPGGAITDLSCNQPTTSQIVRTFNVPTSFTVRDVDLGVFLTHTYRSDLRIFLTSPAGSTVTVMTWTGNVQDGNNLNDLFNDEAAAAIGTHVGAADDPLTPTPPPYSHSFRPSNPLSAFDGQNAAGSWTLRICDAVGADVGNFLGADLYITRPMLTVTKSSSVVEDFVSVSNPKAIPGSRIRYCVLMTNSDSIAMSNIAPTDSLPPESQYFPASLRSGTTCAGATTVEDDNNIGADESDPFGVSINGTGTIISGSAASLAAGGTFAMVYDVLIN
jgi:uncharacterized repeat protein (TIGR01451 family)